MKSLSLVLALLAGLMFSGTTFADSRHDPGRGRSEPIFAGIVTVPSTGLQRHLLQHFEPLNRVHDQALGQPFGPTIVTEHVFFVSTEPCWNRGRRDSHSKRRSNRSPTHGHIGSRSDVKSFLDSCSD